MGLSPGAVRPESNRKGAFLKLTHYLISEASRELAVEAHVLRYWEEELKLEIPRNELGHRYYTEKQLALFRRIKELKELGYQLKAIKTSLNKEYGPEERADEAGFLLEETGPAGETEQDAGEESSEGAEKRFQVLEGQNGEKAADRPEESALHNHGTEAVKADRAGHLDRLSKRLSSSASGPMTEAVLEKMTGKLAEGMERARENLEETEDMEEKEGEGKPEKKMDQTEQKAETEHVYGPEADKPEETGPKREKSGVRKNADPEKSENDGGETTLELVGNGALAASPEKMQQFQNIMTDVLAEALRRNQDILSKEVGGTVSEKLVKEMNYLMRDREEREEERYRKLDETIRACQRVQRQRSEAAATRVPVRGMKKSRFPWGRRKDS